MINHLSGHATIDTDVLTRDETGLVRAEKEHHIGYIQWIANTSCRLLNGIGTFIDGVGRVNPPWRDAVYTNLSSKTDCQGVSQSRYATFCCSITFRLWLTHTVTRGRYIDDGRSFGEMWSKEFGEIERCRNTDTQGILELLIAALVYALHQWQGIVDEIIHMPMLGNHFLSKLLQHLFVCKVAHKVVTLLFINYANCGSKFLEFFCYPSSDAFCTTCDDYYFIFEIHICVSSLNWNFKSKIDCIICS